MRRRLARARELDDAHGANTLAKHVSDIRIRQIVDESHHNHLALLLRELADEAPDPLAVAIRLAGAFWRHEAVFVLERLRELCVVTVLLRLLVVDRQVSGDPQQPGDERYAALLVARDRLQRLQERLRGQAFGKHRIPRKEIGVTEDTQGVLLIDLPERFPVPPGRSLYERAKVGLDRGRPWHVPLPLGSSTTAFPLKPNPGSIWLRDLRASVRSFRLRISLG